VLLQIYNEKVRDLFNPDPNHGGLHGLKVRDNPQTGPYVEDLSRSVITSFKEFEALLDEGNKVRTVAATQMNATSSRAHTVFQIVFTKTTYDEETKKSSAMTSKINLVDLAGSERLAKTGASGQQMKEGIGINKSLTALGNCIEVNTDGQDRTSTVSQSPLEFYLIILSSCQSLFVFSETGQEVQSEEGCEGAGTRALS
jgi:kinesin family protein 1